jgi:hypothetical protein
MDLITSLKEVVLSTNFDDFNKTLKKVQEIIGQDDGGNAGLYFSDFSNNLDEVFNMTVLERKKLMINYINFELVQLLNAEG